ncbi:hypothetical protein DXZ75_27795 [Streptomyces sp. AcE210]|nr:hypothetical protein DXZ75_27795 [Streptomyces sp. AcE210]
MRVKTFARPARLHVPGLDWGLADPSIFELPKESGPDGGSSGPPQATPPVLQPTAGGMSFNQYGPGGTQGLNNTVHNEFGGGHQA